MSKAAPLRICILNRASWLTAVKVCLSLVAIVSAASIAVTRTNYQAEIGSAVTVGNNLIALDRGFSTSPTAWSAAGATCPSSPITFAASPGTANTTITAGHWVFDVRVNSTSSAPASTTSNVTLVLAGQTYGPLCVRTPATSSDNQMIECRFDIGTTLPTSPYSFRVTIQ